MRHALIQRKLGKVDRVLDKAIGSAEIPGAVVLARMPREGEVLEHVSVRGAAVTRPERIAMERSTIFDLASLTKVMATTTAVMLLVERGALALDDPVAKHLPSFAERGKGAVTLRHLGLPRGASRARTQEGRTLDRDARGARLDRRFDLPLRAGARAR